MAESAVQALTDAATTEGDAEDLLHSQSLSDHYLIRYFDRFQLQVTGFPEFSISGVVRPDGRITIPQMGEFSVVGTSVPEVCTAISDTLSRMVTLPVNVDFIITEVADFPIYIFGEVGDPGVYQNKQTVSLLQAIAAAGGLKLSSETKQILIMRQQPDGMVEPMLINLQQLSLQEAQSDIYLAPFDVVYVPKTFITNVGDFIDQYFKRVIPPIDMFIVDRYYWQLATRRIVQ